MIHCGSTLPFAASRSTPASATTSTALPGQELNDRPLISQFHLRVNPADASCGPETNARNLAQIRIREQDGCMASATMRCPIDLTSSINWSLRPLITSLEEVPDRSGVWSSAATRLREFRSAREAPAMAHGAK